MIIILWLGKILAKCFRNKVRLFYYVKAHSFFLSVAEYPFSDYN